MDSGIRYAVTALGSLHEDFEKTGDIDNFQDEFALKQYNMAIRQHLDNSLAFKNDPDKVDNYVASCMVFMCIELLQSHYLSALSLVAGAVNLFYESNADLRRSSAWPLELVEALLSRFQAQAVGLVGPAAIGWTTPPRLNALASQRIPHKFGTIAEARESLEHFSHSHALSRPMRELLEAPPFDEKYMDIAAQWSSAFDALVESLGDNLKERERRALNVLKIWQRTMTTGLDKILTYGDDVDDQTLWDDYEASFEKIIALSESVVSSPNPSDTFQAKNVFTLDRGIVGPLYDTARICRNPVLRRKAINILRMNPRREGLWDGVLAARVAERQMELEESAVAEVNVAADVPGWARINSVVPTFQFGDRDVVIEFSRQPAYPGAEPVKLWETIEC